MSLFRKRPVVIEAFRLGMDNIPDWFMDKVSTNDIILHNFYPSAHRSPLKCAEIRTLEGIMWDDFGDWCILGVKHEIYPCKPDIFTATYEPA